MWTGSSGLTEKQRKTRAGNGRKGRFKTFYSVSVVSRKRHNLLIS